jgi:hypothetical protein
VAVGPDGQDAYIVSDISGAVTMFDRTPTGSLTQKPGLAGCISGLLPISATPGRHSPAPRRWRSALTARAPTSRRTSATRWRSSTAPAPTAPTPPTRSWAVWRSRRPVSPRARSGPTVAARVGANVSYRLSEAAAVRFTVARALRSRRVRARCVKAKRSNRHAQRCTGHQTLRGSFTHRDKTGLNSFTFSGRLRARRLQPGRYRYRLRPRRDRPGRKQVPPAERPLPDRPPLRVTTGPDHRLRSQRGFRLS